MAFVKDTFTDTAETVLTSHTGEIGATWTKHPSTSGTTPKISNANRLKGQVAVFAEVVMYASGTAVSADHAVQADFVALSNTTDDIGICGRLDTAALNYYFARLSFSNGAGIQLYKCVGGAFTQLGSTYSYTLTTGNIAQIRLEMVGTFINVYLNGVLVINQVDGAITTGTHVGIRAVANDTNTSGFHVDNFVGLNQLYWVSGDGNIDSTAHWSRTSAGASGITPLSTHDAIVDQNSGSPTITVNASQTFASLSFGTITQYTDTTKTMTLTGTGTNALAITGDISVYGDAAFGAGLSNISLTGSTYWYQYSTSYIPKITLGSTGDLFCGHSSRGVIYCNVTTLIFSGSGSLTLPLLDVSDSYASLNVGTFDMSSAGAAADVICGNSVMGSEMYVQTRLDLSGGTYTNLQKLVVYFTGATTAVLASKTLASIHINSGSCMMTGDNVANSLVLERDTSLNMTGSCTFGYIAVASNMSIVIGAGKTLTGRLVTQNYNDDAKNVSISSGTAGTRATWNMNNGGKIVKTRWRIQDIIFAGGSIIAYHSEDLGNNLGVSFVTGLEKTFRYAVFDFAGTYIGEYTDVINDPSFGMQMNAPPGQMVIRRGVDPLDFGEGTLVDYDNRVEVTCVSDDHPNGKVIYIGATESYKPNVEHGNQYVDITLMPYGADVAQFPVTDGATNDVLFYQELPKTLLAFSSSKFAFSWTTGIGVVLLGDVYSNVKFANATSITVSLYKDNGSNTPDNTTAVYSNTYTVDNSATPQSIFGVHANIAVSASSKYWLVVDTHGGNTDSTTVYTTNDYAGGNAAYWNGASWVQSSAYGIYSLWTTVTNADTSVTFSAADLRTSLTTVLDTYALTGGTVRYTSGSIEDPGVLFTYDFNSATMLEAIQNFVDQCPAGWYWYIDPVTNLLHLHPQPTTPDHRFTIGIDVQKVQIQKTKATIVNSLYVTGGDIGGGVNLFRNYFNATSIFRYRRRTKFYNDINLVSTTAADAIGEKIIGQSKDPASRAPLTVLSDPDVGADIEILRPGDLFVILGKDATISYLQIGSFTYDAVKAEIEASTVPPQINATLNDTQVAVRQQQNVNNPAAATVVEVL